MRQGTLISCCTARIDPKAKLNADRDRSGRVSRRCVRRRSSSTRTAPRSWPKGEKVILVRNETNPDDVHGMLASQGVLTARGGEPRMRRSWRVASACPAWPARSSCRSTSSKRSSRAGGHDGQGGRARSPSTAQRATSSRASSRCSMPEISGEFEELMRWADGSAASSPGERRLPARRGARARLGAEGIGLCRTEHMFLQQERLPIVQKMILRRDEPDPRKVELATLLPMQRGTSTASSR